jgi:hypothetical protein
MPKATQLLHDHLAWKKTFGSPVDPKSCLGELVKGKTFLHGRDRSGNAVLYHFVRNQDPSARGRRQSQAISPSLVRSRSALWVLPA